MHYLADWRLQVAATKLRDGKDPLIRVAEQVGYEKFGTAPATWRRNGGEASA